MNMFPLQNRFNALLLLMRDLSVTLWFGEFSYCSAKQNCLSAALFYFQSTRTSCSLWTHCVTYRSLLSRTRAHFQRGTFLELMCRCNTTQVILCRDETIKISASMHICMYNQCTILRMFFTSYLPGFCSARGFFEEEICLFSTTILICTRSCEELERIPTMFIITVSHQFFAVPHKETNNFSSAHKWGQPNCRVFHKSSKTDMRNKHKKTKSLCFAFRRKVFILIKWW